jgi:drug/metabolite transporter (DMT)-like permease
VGPALALGASLSWGLGDFLAGLASRRQRLLTVLVVSQGAGLASIATLIEVRGEGPPGARYAVYAVLAGLAGTVGIAALYGGLAAGPMSVVAPVSSTSAVVPLAAGFAAGERPAPLQLLGVGLALAGVVLAAREPGHGERPRAVAAGAGLALVAALAFGLLLVALDAASEGDPLWATATQRTTSFSLFALAWAFVRPAMPAEASALGVLALIGILDTAGNALFATASTRSLLSLAAVLAQLYPIVTVVLARFVLHERITRRQQVGVAAAFAGVGLITAG